MELKNLLDFSITRIIAFNSDKTSAEVKLGECFKSLSGSNPTIKPDCNVKDATFSNPSEWGVREFTVTDKATEEVIQITSYYQNINGPASRFFVTTEVANKFLAKASNLKESRISIGDFQPTDEQRAYLEKKHDGKTPGYAPLVA